MRLPFSFASSGPIPAELQRAAREDMAMRRLALLRRVSTDEARAEIEAHAKARGWIFEDAADDLYRIYAAGKTP